MRVFRILMLAALVAAPNAVHAGLAPTKGSQLVTAYTFGACPINGHTGVNSALVSQMVGGDGAVTPFVIPPKRIFVITDITASTGSLPPGDVIVASVLVGTAAFGTLVGGRFDPVSASGTITTAFTFPAGVAVKSGAALCVELLDVTHGGFVGFTAFAHGYFAPDK